MGRFRVVHRDSKPENVMIADDGYAKVLDLVDYRRASISADGSVMTAVGAEYQASLYVVPLDGATPQRIPSERRDGLLGVARHCPMVR